MIPPMNHSNYRLPVLPFEGTGSRVEIIRHDLLPDLRRSRLLPRRYELFERKQNVRHPAGPLVRKRIENARSGRNLPPDAAHPPRRRCERHRIRHGRQPAGRDIPLFFAADGFGRCTGHRHGPQRRYGDRNGRNGLRRRPMRDRHHGPLLEHDVDRCAAERWNHFQPVRPIAGQYGHAGLRRRLPRRNFLHAGDRSIQNSGFAQYARPTGYGVHDPLFPRPLLEHGRRRGGRRAFRLGRQLRQSGGRRQLLARTGRLAHPL